MQKRLLFAVLIGGIFLLTVNPALYAAGAVTIQGVVRDAQTNDVLPGANVVLAGTSMGASTDINGKYVIRNVPAGTYSLRALYVGYLSVTVTLQVQEGVDITRDFKLTAVSIQGETVVVTAQALGQNQAINQQLTAPSIMNVVSSARIQELPDANAAESIGRLPGVSVLRSGGEGSMVVIRGLSPQYNAITIDGVRMSPTDPDVRAVDLSMISPNMLEGITVMKAITPDQDADALGGVVDFKIKEAGYGKEGPAFDLLAQGGYNKLMSTYNDYKFVATASARFLDERFGVLAQGNIERRDRSDDVLGAAYHVNSPKLGQFNLPLLTNVSINEVARDRKRAGGTLVLDYVLPDGKITFANFYNSGDAKEQDRYETYNVGGDKDYNITDTRQKLNVLTNLINYDQSLGFLKMNLKLSHSYSENRTPTSIGAQWYEPTSLGTADPRLPPSMIPALAKNNLNLTVLQSLSQYSSLTEDRDYTAALNFNFDANFSDQITNAVKFGGKYRHKIRSYWYDQSDGSYYLGSAQNTRQAILNAFPWMGQRIPGITGNDNMPITLFIDPNYKYASFFDGQYTFTPNTAINIPLMWQIIDVAKQYGTLESWYHANYTSNVQNYNGTENGTAFYVMDEMSIGPQVKFIPGVRYERLQTEYTAPRGTFSPLQRYNWPFYDTTMSRQHDFWLPMAHLRYKPLEWFDVRFAYTQTLTYPDFVSITPLIDIGTGSVNYHNVDLKPSKSENFDLYASIYDNSVGLFTAGAFLKHINDLIFAASRVVVDPNMYPGLPAYTKNYNPINTYINDPNRVTLWGLEFDWQTHFWYLPDPFKGLVLNINYTHVFSEARYPQTIIYTQYIPVFKKTVVDTFYTDRLINQPNNIANLSIGYDYKGFSARVSMLYTDNIFSSYNFWSDLDQETSSYLRWDLSVKQNLPWYGLQLFFDWNNINARHDLAEERGNHFPASEQDYGMTADLGIRWIY